MPRPRLALLSGGALLATGTLLALAGPASAAGTTRVVDDSTGSAACAGATYTTIQSAVDAATAGDTIKVCAGTYPESVNVGKSLTFMGAQAGVDARTGRTNLAAESALTPTSGAAAWQIQAPAVTIDGFTARDLGNAISGVLLESGDSLTVRNSVLEGDERGVYTSASGTGALAFTGNRISSTNGAEGGLFFSASASSTSITDNAFSGTSPAINVSPGVASTGFDVRRNAFTGSNNAMVLNKVGGVTFAGNTVTGNDSSALFVGGGVAGLTVSGNSISSAANGGSAVRVSSVFNSGPTSDLVITGNRLVGNIAALRVSDNGSLTGTAEVHFNRIVGDSAAGVDNQADAAINAEDNYWGCNEGPAGPATSSGQNANGCDVVLNSGTGSVDYTPWLTLSLSATPTGPGSATLTASLRTNSDGADTSAQGTVPDGTPVAFAAMRGTVAPASTVTTAGQATSTLTFPSGSTSSASVTVDRETVTIPVSDTPTPASMPEVPLAALLPLSGLALAGAVLLRRRRRGAAVA